jgi:hypothetical protein
MEKEMKFKRNVIDKRITSEDYHGKPCTLTPYARLKIWKERQPKPFKEEREKDLWRVSIWRKI